MSRIFLALLLTITLYDAAWASSPDAWSEHYRDVVRNCLSRSELRDAKPEGDLMLFSDEVGTALLVRGFARDSRKSTLALCVQRRGSSKVEVQRVYDGTQIDRSMLPASTPAK